jgi:hypothetical protein
MSDLPQRVTEAAQALLSAVDDARAAGYRVEPAHLTSTILLLAVSETAAVAPSAPIPAAEPESAPETQSEQTDQPEVHEPT